MTRFKDNKGTATGLASHIKLSLQIAALVGLQSVAMSSFAMPALDEIIALNQPDGTAVQAIAKGDEWNNRMENTHGYTIAKDSQGVYRYVIGFGADHSPVMSDVRAEQEPPPGLAKHLSSSRQRPEKASGTGTSGAEGSAPQGAPVQQSSVPILFILTEFNDQKGGTTEADWASFVSDNIRDFYNKTSHSNADMLPAADTSGGNGNGVINWVNVGYNHPNTGGNTGSRNRDLSADAIAAADPYIDYSLYDANGDGWVDGDELSIVVIVAGYETAYGGTGGALSPSVWGHKWGWFTNFPTHDGVRMTEYAQFGEYHATSLSNKHQATMGIMVHELGHLSFGLPDLYDTDGSSSGIGAFGLMSGGSWGAASDDQWAGETPVNACAWSKYSMNWVNGFEGSGTETVAASGYGTAGDTVFRASSGISSQYFLVENRQPVGYDRGLERYLGSNFGGGIAIWHIDDTRTSNSTDTHRWVDLEEGDGSEMRTSSGSVTDLRIASRGATFSATTNPNSNLYNGSASGVEISGISNAALQMTATFGATISDPLAAPTNLSANAVSSSAINLIWTDNASGEEGYRVDRSEDGGSSWTPIETTLSADTQSYTDSGLAAGTTYHYLVRAFAGADVSADSNTASATTQQPAIEPPPIPTSLSTSNQGDGSALVTWNDAGTTTDYFELEREKEHSKRPGVWNSTTLIGPVSGTSYTDTTGDGNFRYRVRAVNTGGPSGWTSWSYVTVTGSSGGGGGGGKPCKGKNCSAN